MPSLSDLKGQDRVRPLLESLASKPPAGRVYLFIGPKEAGQETAARALAAAWLCPKSSSGRPCKTCPACLKLDAGVHPDFVVIEPLAGKEKISVDQARELIKGLCYAPLEGSFRVVLVPQAERLSLEAANALLKTLEELPEDTAVILTAAEAEMLPPTIISRCQQIAFSPVAESTLAAEIEAAREIDHHQARFLAALSGGSLKRALELEPDEVLARRELVLEKLGRLRASDPGALFDLAQEVASKPEEVEPFLTVLGAWYRDLMISGAGRAELLANQDLSERLISSAARAPSLKWAERLEAVLEAQAALAARANVRLCLEALLLKLVPGLAPPGGRS